MQAAEPFPDHIDAMRDEINTRKAAVMTARNGPAEHLGQYSNGDVTERTASRLEELRRNSAAMRTYNEATGRLLSPTRQGPQQHTSKLRAPQQGRSSSVAPMQGARVGSNGYPVALASNGGGGDEYTDGGGARGDTLGGGASADASRDETIDRLNKVVRQKNATIRDKEKELLRYKDLVDSVNTTVDDISVISVTTDQRIEELANDLAVEKRNHEAARRSLEEQSASLQEKTREAERHSRRLAELEHASATAHEENVELSRQIQETNRLAHERQAAAAAAAAGDGPAESPDGEGEGGGGDRGEELDKLKQAVEMKTLQLKAVNERASKTSMELQYFKGQARSGRFKNLLLKLWWLLRTVGFLGFLLFVYVAVSEDAFRSRGVDVYRLAH